MIASIWAPLGGQPWDAALDRMEQQLDLIEPRLAAHGAEAPVGGEVTRSVSTATADWLANAVAAIEPLPTLEGDLPEQLADRARGLLARTDAVALRVAAELSRIDRALRDLRHRVPDRHRHPAYLDTRT